MGRATALSLALALASACGDAILVTGDAPSVMRIVAGVGDSIGTRLDSLATRTKLTDPAALAFDDEDGVLWVADRGALVQSQGISRRVGRLFRVASNGRIARVIDAGGCSASVCLESPFAMAIAPDGALWITDPVGHRVFRLRAGAAALDVVAGTGANASAPDGASAAASPLSAPAGIAFAADGRVFVSERGAHKVRAIAADGTLATVGGTGIAGDTGDGGAAAVAQLRGPAGLALHGSILYVADELNHRIRAIDLDAGTISALAGTGTPAFAGDAGPAIAAEMRQPTHVAVAPDGATLFVADALNDRVRVVDLGSGRIRTFAGTGDPAFVPAGRPAGATSLLRPAAVLISPLGLLFIADPGHSVVWRTVIAF